MIEFKYFCRKSLLIFLFVSMSTALALVSTERYKEIIPSNSFLQLDSKKRVKIKEAKEKDEKWQEKSENFPSFLQTDLKRKLNRNEIEITPQPIERQAGGSSFLQLSKTNLRAGTKIWDTYEEVPVIEDDDENDCFSDDELDYE